MENNLSRSEHKQIALFTFVMGCWAGAGWSYSGLSIYDYFLHQRYGLPVKDLGFWQFLKLSTTWNEHIIVGLITGAIAAVLYLILVGIYYWWKIHRILSWFDSQYPMKSVKAIRMLLPRSSLWSFLDRVFVESVIFDWLLGHFPEARGRPAVWVLLTNLVTTPDLQLF